MKYWGPIFPVAQEVGAFISACRTFNSRDVIRHITAKQEGMLKYEH